MSKPVTLEFAAAETGFTSDALRRKAQRGEIPFYLPFGGGKIIVDLDELQTLMLQNRQPTNEERQARADALLHEMNQRKKQA